jgi:hypothetical protein
MPGQLILTSPRPPEFVNTELPPGVSGTPTALQALSEGNLKRLDDLELAWLNAYGPKPEIKDEWLSGDMSEPGDVPVAVAVWRNLGPLAQTLIEWAMVKPCSRCAGRVFPLVDCRRCGGYGYLNDDGIWDSFYCDADGRVLYTDDWPTLKALYAARND